jgi:endonuclease/exonuclease/phosphatase family metal-dependent hydrolase
VQLAWCPPKGSSSPHPSGRLRIATWNLANLHARDGQATFGGDDPSEIRFAIDYERIRCYVRLFDPDVLAVQEVDGEDALRRVVDTDVYDAVVSQRPKPSRMNAKQHTGFAYKKGLNVHPQPDFEALDVGQKGRLRYGTRIDLTHNGQTFQLMSVHLKSGCFANRNGGSACNTLFQQVPVLERWIDQAATENMPISCRDNQFKRFIDHIVFDKRAVAFADRTSFRHMTYRQDDRDVWPVISDHCPVIIELWVSNA